jgi:hypothetical protein
VRGADGPVTLLPIPPHRPGAGDLPISAYERAANRATVHAAWRLHYEQVQRSLAAGFPQGWDLHPAQIPTRYAAVYTFFLAGIDVAAERLRNFVERAAQATRARAVFDDAATAHGLVNTFLSAIACGALSEEEALDLTGLTLAELRSRSFAPQ